MSAARPDLVGANECMLSAAAAAPDSRELLSDRSLAFVLFFLPPRFSPFIPFPRPSLSLAERSRVWPRPSPLLILDTFDVVGRRTRKDEEEATRKARGRISGEQPKGAGSWRGGGGGVERRGEYESGQATDCYESGFTRSRWTGSQGKGDTSLLSERGKALSYRV